MPRILIVDDNSLIRNTVRVILASAGHEVIEAGSGLEGLETARRERPDLMLLDYMMPEFDGLELLRRIRQEPELASMPVIMLSAKAAGSLEKEAGDATRGVPVVTKPIKSRELLFLVDAALRRPGAARIQ